MWRALTVCLPPGLAAYVRSNLVPRHLKLAEAQAAQPDRGAVAYAQTMWRLRCVQGAHVKGTHPMEIGAGSHVKVICFRATLAAQHVLEARSQSEELDGSRRRLS